MTAAFRQVGEQVLVFAVRFLPDPFNQRLAHDEVGLPGRVSVFPAAPPR